MELKIDLAIGPSPIPTTGKVKSLKLNMYKVEKISIEMLNYMSNVCIALKDSEKIIINASEKLIEELKVFSIVHNVKIID